MIVINRKELEAEIFRIPRNLYLKMLVSYSDIKEDEINKDILFHEYKYVNIELPLNNKIVLVSAIGITQEDGYIEFAFWRRPQHGAPSGYIHVFDSNPLLKIKTVYLDGPYEEYYSHLAYSISPGESLKVAILIEFSNERLIIEKNNCTLFAIMKVLNDFNEIKEGVEKRFNL